MGRPNSRIAHRRAQRRFDRGGRRGRRASSRGRQKCSRGSLLNLGPIPLGGRRTEWLRLEWNQTSPAAPSPPSPPSSSNSERLVKVRKSAPQDAGKTESAYTPYVGCFVTVSCR